MSILKNTTEGINYPLLPYQQTLLGRLRTGGVAAGEMAIISSGRQRGKSYLTAQYAQYRGVNPCNEISLPMGKVMKPKYQFTRSKWYVAYYAAHYYDTQVFQWCEDNFGPMVQHPDAWSRWAPGAAWSTIRFRDARDYMWFKLRWGA